MVGEGGDRDVLVNVDRNKLSQVIHNMVSNAIKFTPSGGQVTVIATMESDRTLDKGGGRESRGSGQEEDRDDVVRYVKVSVTDTGAGMKQVRGVVGECFRIKWDYICITFLCQEDMNRLFKEVIQFNPEKLQAGGGSGLGLFSEWRSHSF